MVANIDDPPQDIIGKGDPTIGSNPKTMLMLTVTKINIDEAYPQQNNFPKKLLADAPILAVL